MKKFFGLVVLLAALVLGSYYGMGLVTENTLKKNIDIINRSNGIMVDIDKYNRGWFTSSAALNWRLHIPERVVKDQNGQSTTIPPEEYTVQMPLSIYHGPIILANNRVRFGLGYATSNLEVPPVYMAKFSNMFTSESTKPELRLSMFVNYMNNSQLNMTMPQFKMITKENGDQIEWDGMESSINVSSNIKNVEGKFTINGAKFIKKSMQATLGQVNSQYEFHQTSSGLYIGEAMLSLPSFVVTENKQVIVDIEQFSVNSNSYIKDGLFNSTLKLSLNKLVGKDKSYGPGILEVDLSNLDAQVLADINQTVNKIQQGTDSERQQALIALLPELPKLFAKGAQFQVSKLNMVLPQGVIEGNLLIMLPKGESGSPFQLLQKLKGQAKLRVPVSVVRTLELISVTQKLLSQASVQQAMIEQLKKNDAVITKENTLPAEAAALPAEKESQDPANKAPVAAAVDPSTPTQGSDNSSKPVTVEDIDKQASIQTDQKLTEMVQSGLLVLQGNEYSIDISLSQGQLSVNGKPFSPSMLQF